MAEQRLVWLGAGADVQVAGEFNGWTPQVAERRETGWELKLNLQPGRYQYKWVVDGNWLVDTTQKTETDESGNQNNVLTIDSDGSEVSGDSDSWERVSMEDVDDKTEPPPKEEADQAKVDEIPSEVEVVNIADDILVVGQTKRLVERLFSPSAECLKVLENESGVERREYPVVYWDTADYVLVKEGVWLKQFLDTVILRRLDKDGINTVEDRAQIESILAELLGYQGSLDNFLEKSLQKSIQFSGEVTRWQVDNALVTLTKEGNLQTVSIRVEDQFETGLKKVYSVAQKLQLQKFKLA